MAPTSPFTSSESNCLVYKPHPRFLAQDLSKKVRLIHECLRYLGKGKVYIWAKWLIRPELIPVSVAWSDYEYFYSPMDGMQVHRRVTPSSKFAGTHLYTWVERGTVKRLITIRYPCIFLLVSILPFMVTYFLESPIQTCSRQLVTCPLYMYSM